MFKIRFSAGANRRTLLREMPARQPIRHRTASTLILTISLLAAAPTLSASCADRLLDMLMEAVEKNADTLDGICLALHGAGCAEQTDDLETYILRRVRSVVGAELPIMITLDLHGNLSDEMIGLVNGVFGIKHYPHVDQHETGALAMRALLAAIESGKKPQTAIAHLPMIIPLSAGYTFEEPFTTIHQHFKAYQEQSGDNIKDITLFHGFPLADTKDTQTSVVVVAETGAQASANELARYVWQQRDRFSMQSLSAAEALDRAEAF